MVWFCPFTVLAFLLSLSMVAIGVNGARNHTLFHKCSGRTVRIENKKIQTSETNDSFVDMKLESPKVGQVNIYFYGVKKYLCFNKRGNLVLRRKHRNRKICRFNELIVFQYTMFQSVFHKNWFLGFNKNGRPVNGASFATSESDDCFQFMKKNLPKYFDIAKHNNVLGKINGRPTKTNSVKLPSELDNGSKSSGHSKKPCKPNGRHRKRHCGSRTS